MNNSKSSTIVFLALLAFAGAAGAGETLYNGIALPETWPPNLQRPAADPMPVPYLESPPEVLPIDVGRQLFVDDFLIAETTLERRFHQAEFHPAGAVVKPDKPWETRGKSNVAYPYSGGVWYDPADKLFKIWYSPGNQGWITHWFAYATSKDGVHWHKPAVEGIKNRPKELAGTNIVIVGPQHDSSTVWLDHAARDPNKRFKYFTTERRSGWQLAYRTSRDGVHWTEPLALSERLGDRTTVFYNPFRKVWVVSERIGWNGRARAYTEDRDPKTVVTKLSQRVKWCSGEKADPRNPDPKYEGIAPQLYNLDVAPYESLMLGLFSIWQGPDNNIVKDLGIQKRCDLLLGFSRDGFHWHRASRERFIAASWKEGTWNFGNIQSASGGCLVVGDKLYFYVSARAKDPTGLHGNGSTGLAILRRDGFASMRAAGKTGTLTTRPVKFNGKYLFVNVNCPEGNLQVEALDKDGKVLRPFTADNCVAIKTNCTSVPITWKGAEDLSGIAGKPVRFRFHVRNGSLFSFWVSPNDTGASHGYVGAGGPGFTGPTDTEGRRANPCQD